MQLGSTLSDVHLSSSALSVGVRSSDLQPMSRDILTIREPYTTHDVGSHVIHVYLNLSGVMASAALHETAQDAHRATHACPRFMIANRRPGHARTVVAVCRRRAPKSPAPAGVALCLPPVYGKELAPVLQRLDAHLAHHRQLGVMQTFVYSVVPLASWRAPTDVATVYLPWVHLVLLHARGQEWQINDCTHRAAARGYAWVLHIDLDEFVRLPAGLTLPGLAHVASADGHTVVTFGSRPGATMALASSRPPECRGPDFDAGRTVAHLCLNNVGGRKHMAHAASVWAGNLHTVQSCRPAPQLLGAQHGAQHGARHRPIAHHSADGLVAFGLGGTGADAATGGAWAGRDPRPSGVPGRDWWGGLSERPRRGACRFLHLDARTAFLAHLGDEATIRNHSERPRSLPEWQQARYSEHGRPKG